MSSGSMSLGIMTGLVIGLGALLLGPAPASAQHNEDLVSGATLTFPETRSGECARAFLEMWNSGTFETRVAFEKRFASKSRLSASGAEARAARVDGLRERFGLLIVERVSVGSDGAVTLVGVSDRGEPLELAFQMSSEEPGRLDAVMIAAGEGAGASQTLTPEERARAVRAVATALEQEYVYPEIGAEMAGAVRAGLESGAYDGVESTRDLAQRLTDDLRAISHDRHLGVRPAPAEAARAPEPFGSDDALRRGNFAFKKAEVLDGNVGYIRLDGFVPGEEAERTAAAALAFVAHCDALVFDLRYNGGGSPEMIRFIQSYLFEEPTHLNDMVDREGEVVAEYWTLEEVPGRRFDLEVPVFVLTSDYTFSGGEEFAYNLQNLGRAVVIGEKTGGGAHPVRGVRVGDHLVVGIPFMRARNPISGTNWEGAGVSPDIGVPADEALERALKLARGSRSPG